MLTRRKHEAIIALLLALAAAALVLLSDWLIGNFQLSRSEALLVALLPAPFYLGLLLVVLSLLRGLDELQQRVQLEAAAISLLGTAVTTLFYGFFQRAGAPCFRVSLVWPLMLAFYGIGYVVARRHYHR